VWKSLTLTLFVIAALMLPLVSMLPPAAYAQGGPVRVWYALPDGDADAVSTLAESFSADTGVAFEVTTIDAPAVFDRAVAASEAGAAPDVIIASNNDAEPLISYGLIAPTPTRSSFFLQELLTAYPDLADMACGDTDLAACLWPDVSSTVPLAPPQTRAVAVATTGLCDASPWLPFCDGSALAMVPLGWDFTLYLISADWLAEEGLDLPVSADDVLDLRRTYALSLTEAQPGRIPTASQAGFPPVYVVSSTLLANDADDLMTSLESFDAAGYWPVVALNIYGAYISANAANRDAAAAFVAALAGTPQAKAMMMLRSDRLPALTPDEVAGLGIDDEMAVYTLRALALLTTYAGMAGN
jgi:hypothetical protein